MKRTVAVVTMGCARNEVDSEELAGRLAADGWTLVDDVELAEVALVNTCGFIESAKRIQLTHFLRQIHSKDMVLLAQLSQLVAWLSVTVKN